jgi:hypothetical protein
MKTIYIKGNKHVVDDAVVDYITEMKVALKAFLLHIENSLETNKQFVLMLSNISEGD